MLVLNWIIPIVVVLIALFYIVQRKSLKINEDCPYYAKKPLSQPEQVLYFRLIDSLPEYIILAQVQLSRLLGVKKGHNFYEWNNKINRMSCDFVVCRKDSSIVAVIELDDKTHQKPERQKADEKKDKALTAANVKIIRWNVKELPNSEKIKTEIKNILSQ
jgi:very-short-patch-repair endonuclease